MGPFAELFGQWKADVNWTEGEIADQVGVSRSAVNQWINDQARPSLQQLPALARLMGRDWAELAAIILGEQRPEGAAPSPELAHLLSKAQTLAPAELARVTRMLEAMYPTPRKARQAEHK